MRLVSLSPAVTEILFALKKNHLLVARDQFPVPAGALSPEVSLGQVRKWNPELIVLSICGAGSLAEPTLITKRAGWDHIPAVQKGNVKVIDDSLLNRPGPRLVEGAQRLYAWIFELMH